ncbi:hypothetical protein CMV_027270 [Castanea mollissima]|uniref:Trichome birefringence-like N-terminal domain-containing protein n=1 Tax=Castanea mollissima TaxID=60419 RepID=A0A8J4VF60_9ROSI|nr:hypothetical protein CMV_027270 [Castanea mollissima]
MAKPKFQLLCFILFLSIFLCLFHGESSELELDDESWLNEEDNEVIMVQSRHDSRNKCDFSTGKWVYDLSYPLYDSSCPYLSTAVTCQKNGRPDSDYEKWKWKPQGYYKEKNGKIREKKAEMAAHMEARATADNPQLGPAAPSKETKELERRINSNPVEINAAMIEEGVNVEEGLQLSGSNNPRVSEELSSHCNSTLTQKPVLVHNFMATCPDKVTLKEVIGNPVVTEIKEGVSQFNLYSMPSSSIQRPIAINDITLAASANGVLPHGLNDQDEVLANQSTGEPIGQLNSLITWKRVMRQGNNGVHVSQPESEKKRKSSFNPLDEPPPPPPPTNVFRSFLTLMTPPKQWWRLQRSPAKNHESTSVELA